ncbi:MAG: recombinase family protein [Armatimonadota bacterium]
MSRRTSRPAAATTPTTRRVIRCAVYTRKSTDEGLNRDFTTLDAQREASEAYIASQQHEGWIALPTRYDDGGFSGATLDRPAMQRLLTDIEAGKIDALVCYKLDRVSRSLLDFLNLNGVPGSARRSADQRDASHTNGHQHGPVDALRACGLRRV